MRRTDLLLVLSGTTSLVLRWEFCWCVLPGEDPVAATQAIPGDRRKGVKTAASPPRS